MSLDTVLECRSVSRHFELINETVPVLNDISFAIHKGDMASIVGKSGSGKTTLLNLMAGLDDPSQGEVYMAGNLLRGIADKPRAALRNKHMGFVFQFHHLLPEFSALDNVLMPCRINGKISKEEIAYAQELLQRVGLESRVNHRPAELSGGERQRVAIARALIRKPDFVLMDEPTGNLDESTSEQVQQVIEQLNAQLQASFIIVTHNQEWASKQPVQFSLTKGQLHKIR